MVTTVTTCLTLTYIVHVRRKQITIIFVDYFTDRLATLLKFTSRAHITALNTQHAKGSLCRVQNYGFNIHRRKC